MTINRGMDKENVVQIYSRILLSHRKEWNNVICSWMDLEIVTLSNIRRTKRYDITYIWNLKRENKWTYLQKKQSYRCREQTSLSGVRWGINRDIGVGTCTLLHMKQTAIKDLLYSTGNSSQYSLMIYVGKESKKRRIYMIHFSVHLKLTQLHANQINYILQ